MSLSPPVGSVVALSWLEEQCRALQRSGKKIVWTNGCFDILHVGHLSSLEEARSFGDVLVVGLNSDASVRALKGEGRPVNNAQDRGRLLAALRPVDYVVIFEETSPANVLACLRPDIYAKGADYTLERLNQDERRCVEGYGGCIRFLKLIDGKSTTNTIASLQG